MNGKRDREKKRSRPTVFFRPTVFWPTVFGPTTVTSFFLKSLFFVISFLDGGFAAIFHHFFFSFFLSFFFFLFSACMSLRLNGLVQVRKNWRVFCENLASHLFRPHLR